MVEAMVALVFFMSYCSIIFASAFQLELRPERMFRALIRSSLVNILRLPPFDTIECK